MKRKYISELDDALDIITNAALTGGETAKCANDNFWGLVETEGSGGSTDDSLEEFIEKAAAWLDSKLETIVVGTVEFRNNSWGHQEFEGVDDFIEQFKIAMRE